MRLLAPIVLLASLLLGGANAFQVAPPPRTGTLPLPQERTRLFASTEEEDCGCGGPEILSGDVPEQRKSQNPRLAMRKASVYRVSGESVSMDELIGGNGTEDKLSVVVFLRSLG